MRQNGCSQQVMGVQQPYTQLTPYTPAPPYVQLAPYEAPQQIYPVPPTGAPLGPQYTGPFPAPPAGEQPVTTLTGTQYTAGYLRTQIGRYVKVEFLIGTNMLVDREGTLVQVGTSYIIIQEPETDDLLLCDLYSIKFVRFYY